MGSPDVRAFSRNKRGVAGSLVWINFDRHALLNVIRKAAGKFIANKDDVRPQFRVSEQEFLSQVAIFESSLVRSTATPIEATIDLSAIQLSEVSGFKEQAAPWYSDQILPFDVTLAGTNENGAASAMKIFGVEILNEGSGVSISGYAVTRLVFRGRTRSRGRHGPPSAAHSAAANGPLTGLTLCCGNQFCVVIGWQ